MRRSGIYRIDLGNDWFYIGSSGNLERRKNDHLTYLQRGKHGNRIMQNVWNKYAKFEFTVLEFCDETDLLFKEQTRLDVFSADPKCANITPTAGSPRGIVRSAETRAKLSALAKKRVFSAETRAKMSATRKNPSAETRAKISAGCRGRVLSLETRAKMSEAKQNPSAETRAKHSAANRLRGPRSAETRAKISAAKQNPSAEMRAKLSAGQKRRQASVRMYRMEQLAMEALGNEQKAC